MTIRNFEDISSIRHELRVLNKGCKEDTIALNAIRRILSTRQQVRAAKTNPALLQTRTGDSNTKPLKVDKSNKVSFSVVQKLTQLVADRQDKYRLALHINELIRQNFSKEEGDVGAVAKKLMDLSNTLIEQTKKLYRDSEATLGEQGNKNFPEDLKTTAKELLSSIYGEFNTNKEDVKVKYYNLADNSNTDKGQRFINMVYISISPFEGNNVVRRLNIVISRRKEASGKETDYIRTFTNEVTPAAILRTNLGSPFTDSGRAFTILMTSLKVDNIIDNIDPSQIPVKKSALNYTNPFILKNDIDEQNGVLTFILNSGVTSKEKANEVLQDIFVETTKLIRAIHPRSKNVIRASQPQSKKVRMKLSTGGTKVADRWSFKIMFSKPDSGEGRIELPRDKVKQFMSILDVPAESAQEFNNLLKQYLNINISTKK